MTHVELDKLSLAELKQIKDNADNAIKSFELRNRAAAIEELTAVAQKHGYKLADLFSNKNVKAKAPAKYCHPENPNKTWSGKGRQPGWIKNALSSGQSLEDFAI
jgi:DNA-binding protein H-NS